MLESVEHKESVLVVSYIEAASGVEPLSLVQAKEWLRVEHNADDALIELLINSVREQCSRILQIDLRTVTRISEFENIQKISQLPYGPHGTVNSVTLVDENGVETLLTAGTDYSIVGGQYKMVNLYNRMNAVRMLVSCESGYSVLNIPAPLQIFMLRVLADNYEQRESIAIGTITATISAESLAIAQQFNRRAWF
jgi:uncharacterized phiE125 gp8 family phage protein